MTLKKDRPVTKNRGVHTNGRVENIQDELRTVIDHMGPQSPHFNQDFSTASDDTAPPSVTTTSVIEIDNEHKEAIHQLIQDPNAKPIDPNTPRDYSELSSLVTDSIAVYIEPQKQNGESATKIQDVNIKMLNPMQKLSSLFIRNHKNVNTNKNQLLHQQQQQLEEVNLPNHNVDLYRINILQPKSESAPKRVVFDLVDDPIPCTSHAATNTTPRSRKTHNHNREHRDTRDTQLLYKNINFYDEHPNSQHQQTVLGSTFNSNTMQYRSEPIFDPTSRMAKKTIYHRVPNTNCGKMTNGELDSVTRVDVYYFDHGNSAYYHTTDCSPVIMTEILAEKTENYTTKFWAETFGFIHIIFSFITSFILQLLRSVLQSFIRPLTVGVLQIFSDYCIKPLLATIFNALVQPPLIFIYNVATTIRDICDPIAEGLGYFFREIATVFGAVRLVDVKYCGHNNGKTKRTYQNNNVDGQVTGDLEQN